MEAANNVPRDPDREMLTFIGNINWIELSRARDLCNVRNALNALKDGLALEQCAELLKSFCSADDLERFAGLNEERAREHMIACCNQQCGALLETIMLYEGLVKIPYSIYLLYCSIQFIRIDLAAAEAYFNEIVRGDEHPESFARFLEDLTEYLMSVRPEPELFERDVRAIQLFVNAFFRNLRFEIKRLAVQEKGRRSSTIASVVNLVVTFGSWYNSAGAMNVVQHGLFGASAAMSGVNIYVSERGRMELVKLVNRWEEQAARIEGITPFVQEHDMHGLVEYIQAEGFF
jgi:hypothetical protein